MKVTTNVKNGERAAAGTSRRVGRRSGRAVTAAAMREADAIMREIVAGERKRKTLDDVLAEIAAI